MAPGQLLGFATGRCHTPGRGVGPARIELRDLPAERLPLLVRPPAPPGIALGIGIAAPPLLDLLPIARVVESVEHLLRHGFLSSFQGLDRHEDRTDLAV